MDSFDQFASINHQPSVCHCSFHRVPQQPDEQFLGHTIRHNASTDDARGVGFSVYPWSANGPLVSQSFWTKDAAKEYVQRLTDEAQKKRRGGSSIVGLEPGEG